jgi:hypothetical protein
MLAWASVRCLLWVKSGNAQTEHVFQVISR